MDDTIHVIRETWDEVCPGCGLANLEQPTPANPDEWRCLGCGITLQVVDFLPERYGEVEEEDEIESNMVSHARREMRIAGVEEDVQEWMLGVMREFAKYGHSGGSASVLIPLLDKLLRFKPLTALTNDPGEWMLVADEDHGAKMWQNIRDSEAFSDDGGKSYWHLADNASAHDRYPRYTALDK